MIARLPMCWKDPLYRAARRQQQVAPLVPVTERTTALWPEAMSSPAPDDDIDDVFTPAWLGTGHHYPWDEEPS